MELIANPSETFALVVGIAKYQESSWNIKSGATVQDALKFATWLLRQGVPEPNIKLCLSSLEENQDPLKSGELPSCNLPVKEASGQNISKIITDFLAQKSGDLLCIYWAGHGLITPKRERRLFCTDTTKQNWQNIDLDSLLIFLNSDSFKIRNHICIIDACANYILETSGRPTNLGGYAFSSGRPNNSQQFILLATKEGEKAKVNSDEKTGYFSQALLEALEKSPSDVFPPNMKTIAESVKQRVVSLKKDQSPTYLYYRNWDGDEEEVKKLELEPDKGNAEEELNESDIEILKELLLRSKLTAARQRSALCIDLGLNLLELPIPEDVHGSAFATELINYLKDTENKQAIGKLVNDLSVFSAKEIWPTL
jgi:hypothetical protein